MHTVLQSPGESRSTINDRLTKADKIRLLRDMYRIRRFEQTSLKYYNLGRMGGFLHLYSGQEAVAVGTISLLGENDHVITAYRDHGHALAVGMCMNECMAELFGKATGCSKGKGGSMHFFAPDKRYWGGHGIVGGQTPLGAGIAYALKYKHIPGCCLCYLGDGAINQGAFHEALNLAALFQLPVDLHHREQRLLHGHQPKALLRLQDLFGSSAPKPTTWLGMSSSVKTSTRCVPVPTSPLSAPVRLSNRPCSRSRLTAITATRSRMRTRRNIAAPKRSTTTRTITIRSKSSPRALASTKKS